MHEWSGDYLAYLLDKVKISIIIPALNEQEFIGATLGAVERHSRSGIVAEIILIDSGSVDDTVRIAQGSELCNVYEHPELKGAKYAVLNQGAVYATGDVLLFLDADTLLPEGFDVAIRQVIDRGYVGGAFEFSLDGKGLSLRFIELVNRIRYRLGQRYYGDQAVFCSRKAFDEVGGYPPLGILESAHFCARLLRLGKLRLIKQKIITSSRRFEQHRLGPLWVLAADTRVFLLDKFGFKNKRFAEEYWKFNDKVNQ